MDIIISVGVIASIVAAYYARKAYIARQEASEPKYDIGFPSGNKVVHEHIVEIKKGSQRVYFRVINRSAYPVPSPWCSVKFPQMFKHPHKDDPSVPTANSTLGEYVLGWGEKGQPITHLLRDKSDGSAEVRGILAADFLRPNDPKDFWIRFKLPDQPDTWEIEINVDAVGVRSGSQVVRLIGRHP